MTITAAQFAQWSKDQASKVTVLAEVKFGYESASLPAEGTIYLADRAYVTAAGDAPSNTRYRDVILKAPEFERLIDLRKLGGQGQSSVGDLTLNNADGSLDFLLEAILDGRDVSLYVGDKDWSRADFRLYGVAVVQGVKATDDTKIVIGLTDRNYLLNATLVGAVMATGPNAGKPKPIIFGDVPNVDLSPYLYDTAGPSYYFNDYAMVLNVGANIPIADVRDSGLSLQKANFSGTNATITANAATDTITRVAHGLAVNDVAILHGTTPFAGLTVDTQYWVIAAGLTADDFRLSLTRGGAAVDITGTTFSGTMTVLSRRYFIDFANASLTLSSSPVGRVTASINSRGASGASASQNRPHYAMQLILDSYTKLTAAYRDQPSFDQQTTYEVTHLTGWGYAVTDRANVQDVLDDISTSTNTWYAQNANGLLAVGRLELDKLDSGSFFGVVSIDTTTRDDIIGDLACENLPLQFGQVLMDYSRNNAVQSDGLAAAVSDANRSIFGLPYYFRLKTIDPVGTDYLNDWWNYHKTAIDSAPIGTGLTTNAVASPEAEFRRDMFKPWTRVARCTVGLNKYALNPGDCITLIYPRYSLSAGKLFRVMSIKTRASDRKVDLVLARQLTPDFSTASHV